MAFSIIMDTYEKDHEFARIVDELVDQVHEPKSYEWVNRRALESFNYAMGTQLTLETLTQDHPQYQVFVDNQVYYLRNIVMMALARM